VIPSTKTENYLTNN